MLKLVAVIGGKHSGKTTVVEHLIVELKHRGYRVGALKEMVRIPTLDTRATETDRYKNAGAEIIVAVPRSETVIFIDKRLSVVEILPHLKGLDFAILEGFEHERALPKIISAKTADEVKSYFDGSAVAVSGLIVESQAEAKKAELFGVPLFKSLTQAGELADLVEEKGCSVKRCRIGCLICLRYLDCYHAFDPSLSELVSAYDKPEWSFAAAFQRCQRRAVFGVGYDGVLVHCVLH